MPDSKIDTVVSNTLIVDVATRSVSNGTKTIWEVLTQDGTKWATFKNDLGNKALALKGQQADLSVSIAQKGDFTNYYLNNVRPASGASTPSPVAQAITQAQAAQPQAPAVSYDQYKDLEEGKEQRKNESIHRQTATKVAAHLSSDITEFWANVESLVLYYKNGISPLGANTAAAPVESSVTSHSAPVQESFDSAPAHGDDDIPF